MQLNFREGNYWSANCSPSTSQEMMSGNPNQKHIEIHFQMGCIYGPLFFLYEETVF